MLSVVSQTSDGDHWSVRDCSGASVLTVASYGRRIGVENLFSYGSLREKSVQREVFGHLLEGVSDAIVGYRLGSVTITDQKSIAISGTAAHQILEPTGRESDKIEGMLFQLSARDLELADSYEDAAYQRVRVRLRSGTDAWVYVKA